MNETVEMITTLIEAGTTVGDLIDQDLLKVSGTPEVEISDLEIRISGSGRDAYVEIENLETETDLDSLEVVAAANIADAVVVNKYDLLKMQGAAIAAAEDMEALKCVIEDARAALREALTRLDDMCGGPLMRIEI